MPFYELVYITRQDLAANEVDNLTEKFKKILEQEGGKLVSKESIRELSKLAGLI